MTKMRAVSRYSLAIVDREKHRARVARNGDLLAVAVDGVCLEAQFELSDGSALLWLTEDSPYDEGLHIYLLGQNGCIEDALEAGADFTAGLLKIGELGGDYVNFEFFTNMNVYQLNVTRKPGLRLRLPAGWKYKHWLKSHRLTLSILKKGAT
ncbi:hypothetical protein WME90_43055 [Sorangium sp. So ce375]|uniref:hypothetical protein n=1 Tax=Sorangium sp. So ce375 TaxID=3133306 RepID=UPI003F5B2BD6